MGKDTITSSPLAGYLIALKQFRTRTSPNVRTNGMSSDSSSTSSSNTLYNLTADFHFGKLQDTLAPRDGITPVFSGTSPSILMFVHPPAYRILIFLYRVVSSMVAHVDHADEHRQSWMLAICERGKARGGRALM